MATRKCKSIYVTLMFLLDMLLQTMTASFVITSFHLPSKFVRNSYVLITPLRPFVDMDLFSTFLNISTWIAVTSWMRVMKENACEDVLTSSGLRWQLIRVLSNNE